MRVRSEVRQHFPTRHDLAQCSNREMQDMFVGDVVSCFMAMERWVFAVVQSANWMLEENRSRHGRFSGQDAVDVSLKRSVGQCAVSARKWRNGAQIRWLNFGLEVWFFVCLVRGARCQKKTAVMTVLMFLKDTVPHIVAQVCRWFETRTRA